MPRKKKYNINQVIRTLILSDFTLLTGYGLLMPIFAVFVQDKIVNGNVEVIGFAAAIYWLVKAVVSIPFGRYLDRTLGEDDDLAFVVIGNLISSAAIAGYLFATLPWHIYVLQIIYAIGMGMNIPAFTAIFTRHIDHGQEAFEWSLHSSIASIGTGVAGAVGGMIAYRLGFDVLILGVVIFYVLSGLLPLAIMSQMNTARKKSVQIPPPKIHHQ